MDNDQILGMNLLKKMMGQSSAPIEVKVNALGALLVMMGWHEVPSEERQKIIKESEKEYQEFLEIPDSPDKEFLKEILGI